MSNASDYLLKANLTMCIDQGTLIFRWNIWKSQLSILCDTNGLILSKKIRHNSFDFYVSYVKNVINQHKGLF